MKLRMDDLDPRVDPGRIKRHSDILWAAYEKLDTEHEQLKQTLRRERRHTMWTYLVLTVVFIYLAFRLAGRCA